MRVCRGVAQSVSEGPSIIYSNRCYPLHTPPLPPIRFSLFTQPFRQTQRRSININRDSPAYRWGYGAHASTRLRSSYPPPFYCTAIHASCLISPPRYCPSTRPLLRGIFRPTSPLWILFVSQFSRGLSLVNFWRVRTGQVPMAMYDF